MFLDNFNYSILGANTESRIVFIHGLMAFSANWRKIASRLENEFQCLIYDQRGHGRSFKPEHGYSPEDFAEDLNKMTDELGWDQFHLVGHSMGGRNAIVFAHLYPHKVKSLVIEDMGPDTDPEVFDYYSKLFSVIPTPFNSKEDVKIFFENQFLLKFTPKEPPQVLITFLQANIEEKTNGVYDWRFSKAAVLEIVNEGHKKNRWNEVAGFKMPVLLIRGEKSHVLSSETYEKMLVTNSLIKGLEIKYVGHWVHFEKYEEFVTELRNWIHLHNA